MKWLLLVKIKGMKKFKTEDKLKILIATYLFKKTTPKRVKL